MVTYNVRITVGTPEQELTVIFDTGSFMCAVFSDVSPKGMKELGLLSVRDYIGRSTYTPPGPWRQRRLCVLFDAVGAGTPL